MGISHNAVEAGGSAIAAGFLFGLYVAFSSEADGWGPASSSELFCVYCLAALSNCRYAFVVSRALDVVMPPVVAVSFNRPPASPSPSAPSFSSEAPKFTTNTDTPDDAVDGAIAHHFGGASAVSFTADEMEMGVMEEEEKDDVVVGVPSLPRPPQGAGSGPFELVSSPSPPPNPSTPNNKKAAASPRRNSLSSTSSSSSATSTSISANAPKSNYRGEGMPIPQTAAAALSLSDSDGIAAPALSRHLRHRGGGSEGGRGGAALPYLPTAGPPRASHHTNGYAFGQSSEEDAYI